MLYKVVLRFESVDEILKCDHSNESYWAVLSCGADYCTLKVVFWMCFVVLCCGLVCLVVVKAVDQYVLLLFFLEISVFFKFNFASQDVKDHNPRLLCFSFQDR